MKDILYFRQLDPKSEETYFQVQRSVDMPFNGNRILFAIDPNQQEVVTKLIPDLDKANKEWTGLSLAYLAKVPVPTPLIFGMTENKTPGIVSRKIEGQLLYGNKDPEMRHALGAIVNHLHSNLQTDQATHDYSFYEEARANWNAEIFNEFSWAMSQYCQNTPLVFCHGDLHDGQVINSPNGLVLIDFEKWQSDRPLSELGMYLFHCLRTGMNIQNFKNFITGYKNKRLFG